MKKKGSVTVFFSLFMAVFLILIQVMFHSVQIAGGRVQAEAGVEEGLYSVFAGYQRELLEQYHVFFLDGGYGSGTLQPGYMYQILEESINRSCSPGRTFRDFRGENQWKISNPSGKILGYTLATDQKGQAFKMQAVDYMKDTVGIQGIQLLLQQMKMQTQIIKEQEQSGSIDQAKQAFQSCKEEKEKAEQGEQENLQQGSAESVPEDFINPLEVIQQWKDRGILALVLPAENVISSGKFSGAGSLLKRNCEQGMGAIYSGENPNTVWNNIVFQEYMARHLKTYIDGEERDGLSQEGLSYQLEYAVAGKDTDMENLKSVVMRLLAVREAANLTFLLSDPSSQAQIQEMALTICSYIGMPFLGPVVSLALQAAWAFGESVLDVRQLLQGKEIPLIKTGASWQLSLNQLGKLTQGLQSQGTQQKGMNYKEYLRLLLFLGDSQEQVLRTMDIVEQEIRKTEGNGNFRMDLCVSYLKTEIQVNCSGKDFFIEREYGYEM